MNIQVINQELQNKGYKVESHEFLDQLKVEHTILGGWYTSFILYEPQAKVWRIITLANFKIAEDKRDAASIQLAKINHNINFGHYELDYKDGELSHVVQLLYHNPTVEEVIEILQSSGSNTLIHKDKFKPE